MKVQSAQEQRKQFVRWRERLYAVVRRKMTYQVAKHEAPTERERRQVFTGFVLGGLSIIAAFFWICGLPIAIAGLMMGLAGRRSKALYPLATWALALSIIGLALTLLNMIISVSIYFSHYLWR
jgi:hypothetical protein